MPPILPKNKQKQYDLKYQSSKIDFFCSFFGRIEDAKKTFWNQLTFTALYFGLVDARISASNIYLPVLFLIIVFLIKQFSLAFLLLGVYAVGEIADFFVVGDSDARLFSSWTNEQASRYYWSWTLSYFDISWQVAPKNCKQYWPRLQAKVGKAGWVFNGFLSRGDF